jgi:hypothetical protein
VHEEAAPSSDADIWLMDISRRWSSELAATSLADLQAWSNGTIASVAEGSENRAAHCF